MGVAQPIPLGRAAWQALRDGLVEPALAAASGADVLALTRLSAAWGAPQAEGDRVVVFLTPEEATSLAGLLDAHPELAPLLGQ